MRRRMGIMALIALVEATFIVLFSVDYFGAQRVTKRGPLWPATTKNNVQKIPEVDNIFDYDVWVGRLTRIEYGIALPRPETVSS